MKFIPLFLIFTACTPQEWNAVEDAVSGEIKVTEQVMQDLSGSATQQAPDVKMPVKKF